MIECGAYADSCEEQSRYGILGSCERSCDLRYGMSYLVAYNREELAVLVLRRRSCHGCSIVCRQLCRGACKDGGAAVVMAGRSSLSAKLFSAIVYPTAAFHLPFFLSSAIRGAPCRDCSIPQL